ncbi:transposase [Echinicola jeungdonensis]|uniref:transposase n=1 Tax=Echinicola jeungdonensis TaxID=709343 RepID=UPI0025B5942C|nr:transposase [Echinicola jeungdonensis]MDN3671427.1 transposase [Echinicola jeungdonensis]
MARSMTACHGKSFRALFLKSCRGLVPKVVRAKGMFALMFLKAYLNTSDRQLIERFNTDWSLQYFCGKVLAADQQIRDLTIMTRIRAYIEEHCHWEQIQEVLMDHWKQDVDNSHVL